MLFLQKTEPKHPILCQFVKEIVLIKNTGNAPIYTNPLPALISGIGFTLSGQMEIDYGKGYEKAPDFGTRAMLLTKQMMRFSEKFLNISFRMQPWALSQFVKQPLQEVFQNHFFDFEQIYSPDEVAMIRELFISCPSIEQLIEYLEKFLARKKGKEVPTDLCAAISAIHEKNEFKVATVAKSIKISERKLHRLFVHGVGISPNQYIRILKFDRAVKIMQQKDSFFNLSQLALELGYYDQAHFIHEIQKITGVTPKQLSQQVAYSGNSFYHLP